VQGKTSSIRRDYGTWPNRWQKTNDFKQHMNYAKGIIGDIGSIRENKQGNVHMNKRHQNAENGQDKR